jgi:hypothetical protein
VPLAEPGIVEHQPECAPSWKHWWIILKISCTSFQRCKLDQSNTSRFEIRQATTCGTRMLWYYLMVLVRNHVYGKYPKF